MHYLHYRYSAVIVWLVYTATGSIDDVDSVACRLLVDVPALERYGYRF